jgi:hypothetical protein
MSDIDDILYPQLLNSLHQNVPPVQCIVWKGDEEYEVVTFDKVYPFDTLLDIKRMICHYYGFNANYHPNFLFVGVPTGESAFQEGNPTKETTYLPLDYLWYKNGENNVKNTHVLKNPIRNLESPDEFFFRADGTWLSPGLEDRARSTVEHVFLKHYDGQIPFLHVFPFIELLNAYKKRTGQPSINGEDWNKRFGAYYKDLPTEGPYGPQPQDMNLVKKIHFYIEQRTKGIDTLNNLLESGVGGELTYQLNPKVEGIRQLRLIWKKPVEGFEGCGSMFYRVIANENRPYIRLLPAEGSPITKLHVTGVLPIPTLEDPTILDQWGKEISPTPGMDFVVVKYVQPSASDGGLLVYGTIQVFNDGTINLLLQPPKNLKRIDSDEFVTFQDTLETAFEGLPQSSNDFRLKEVALTLKFKTEMSHPRMTKEKIQRRLPYFQNFFQEIPSLPNENPIISLRFKAVSQYASEQKYFTFLTQYATSRSLRGGESDELRLIEALQTEFILSYREAIETVGKWRDRDGKFTVEIPEEGEFIKYFNPGIDVHIYGQHPLYYLHINRIDSYQTYLRVYTLLNLLFIKEDDYFELDGKDKNLREELQEVSAELEEEEEKREENMVNRAANQEKAITIADESIANPIQPNQGSANGLYDEFADLIMDGEVPIQEGEVVPEMAPSAIAASSSLQAAKDALPEPKMNKKQSEVKQNISVDAIQQRGKKEELKRKLVNPKQWFLDKLKEMDISLFKYPLPKKVSGYARLCGAVEDRQPVVMNNDQYERMREIYEKYPIHWILYPLTGSENPIPPVGKEITISIMRYGSSPKNMNYYFCPEYYCLSDEIMVLPKEFKGTTDYYGNPKPKDSCPFCHGFLIDREQKTAVKDRTVMKRKIKKDSNEYHGWISFLSTTTHPNKLALPCCFTTQETLRVSDPRFKDIRSAFIGEVVEQLEGKQEEEEVDTDDLVYRRTDAIEYAVLFHQIYEANILEPNKTLRPGSFGTAPVRFDEFFGQNSFKKIVQRAKIYMRLQANAQGFIRVGTPNTYYESLLGVIAPLLYRNSIDEVKERILEAVVPRVFLNSHFGNLVLEFYNPSDKSAMPTTWQELKAWSELNLGISATDTNTYQLIRIFNSYHRFRQFMKDETMRKDLRHIQPILAEPGLLTPRGIQLIVMEDHGNDQPISIKCPSFGVSMDRNRENDVAFISRSLRQIGTSENKYAHYELYIHTSNKPEKGGEQAIHETIMKWDYSSKTFWPTIVKERVEEYFTQCQSRYRSLFTSQDGVNPMAMIPLSKAIEATNELKPFGIVKDSYNHIVGVTYRSSVQPGVTPLITLPVVDDGVISISSAFSIKHIHLDWDDFKPAPVDALIKYYQEKLTPLFALYPGYKIKYVVKKRVAKKRDEGIIVAVQLANGIFIPASPPKNEALLAAQMQELEGVDSDEKKGEEEKVGFIFIDEFQWSIDKQIAGMKSKVDSKVWEEVLKGTTSEKGCGFDQELIRKSNYVEFEELYQQFRLMVSNWIAEGGEVKQRMEDIIFSRKLPTYEKRKRLDIFISPILQSWFYADNENWEAPASFLRKDCRLINSPESCSGTCYWKQSENGGSCLLHVQGTTSLSGKEGEREVSTPILFTKRVIDELVRFPARRNQLMKSGQISKVSKMVEAIRQGNEYIIPESSPTWTNLLRFEWTKQVIEQPKYYEEMSRSPEEEEKRQKEESSKLPELLLPILGRDSKFELLIPDVINSSQPLLPFLAILGTSFEQMGIPPSTTLLTKEILTKYVQVTSKALGVIDLRNQISIVFAKPASSSNGVVRIIVYLPNQVGILQFQGDTMLPIDILPEALKREWDNATPVKKIGYRIPIAKAKERPPPLVASAPKYKIKTAPKPVAEVQKPVAEVPKPLAVKRNTKTINYPPLAAAAAVVKPNESIKSAKPVYKVKTPIRTMAPEPEVIPSAAASAPLRNTKKNKNRNVNQNKRTIRKNLFKKAQK